MGGAGQQPGEHGHGDDGRHHADPDLAERERRRRRPPRRCRRRRPGRRRPPAPGPPTARPPASGDVQIVLQDRGQLVDALVVGARAAGLLQVHARAEHRPGVAQHDHPDRVVGDRGVEVARQLAADLRGQRVAVARGVQGDRRDARPRRRGAPARRPSRVHPARCRASLGRSTSARRVPLTTAGVTAGGRRTAEGGCRARSRPAGRRRSRREPASRGRGARCRCR